MSPGGRCPSGSRGVCLWITGIALLPLFATPAAAQPRLALELTPSIGWQYGGTFEGELGDVHMNAALSYGASLGARLKNGDQGELSYSLERTELVLRPTGVGADSTLFDINVHYVQAAGLRPLRGGRAQPFLLGSVGATVFDPQAPGYDSKWMFSLAAGLGVRTPLSNRVGLRVQGRFLLPIQFGSGSIFCSSGACVGSLSGGTTVPQGDVSGGLAVKF